MSSIDKSGIKQAVCQGAVEVVNPGILSLLVDAGRKGLGHLGITRGGPLDGESFYWANRLVGNDEGTGVIEVSGGNASFKAMTSLTIAVTGAELDLYIDDIIQPLWSTLQIHTGQTIELKSPSRGLRSYLGIGGGVSVEPVFGSITTVTREGLGGLHGDGQPLHTGDVIPCGESRPSLKLQLPRPYIPVFNSQLCVRLVLGCQYEQFDPAVLASFFTSTFRVTPRMDRMGMCLQGPQVQSPSEGMRSEGLSPGAVQIPPDGQPIVMLKDHQTMGGYPKLGSVLSLDCDALVQLSPGAEVSFIPIDIFDAQNALQLRQVKRKNAKITAA